MADELNSDDIVRIKKESDENLFEEQMTYFTAMKWDPEMSVERLSSTRHEEFNGVELCHAAANL